MRLTEVQEEMLVKKYEKLIAAVAGRFFKRCSRAACTLQDLRSECVLAFIEHIRSCGTEDEIEKFPFYAMQNRMTRFAIGSQVVSYPKRTANFSSIIHSAPSRVCIDDVCEDMLDGGSFEDDALTSISFNDFFVSLPAKQKRIVKMKLSGAKNKEVALSLGDSCANVTRSLQSIRRKYDTAMVS